MKKIIIASLVASSVIYPASANADEISRIQSAPGMSEQAWYDSPQYRSFQCPEGSWRGEGVDMNWTASQADDVRFAYCETPRYLPVPAPTLPTTDTPTATVVPTPLPSATPIATSNAISNSTSASTISSNTTTTTETKTAVVAGNIDWNFIWLWFKAFIAQLFGITL